MLLTTEATITEIPKEEGGYASNASGGRNGRYDVSRILSDFLTLLRQGFFYSKLQKEVVICTDQCDTEQIQPETGSSHTSMGIRPELKTTALGAVATGSMKA